MRTQRTAHTTDILFTLALFCVFAACALMVVVMGADVYRKGADEMQQNFDTRTSIAYISTKLRQNDLADGVYFDEIDEIPALVLAQEIDGVMYNTYLYSYGGSLMEQFTLQSLDPDPQAGRPIMALSELQCETFQNGLLRVTVTQPDGSRKSLLYAPRCQ